MKIKDWFSNGTPYEVGVELFNKYGKSFQLKKLFAKGPNSYNISKLKESLEKLIGIDADNIEAPVLSFDKTNKNELLVPYTPPDLTKVETTLKIVDIAVEAAQKMAKSSPESNQDFERIKEETNKLREEIKLKAREGSRLHAQLEGFKTDEERKEAAFTIKRNFRDVKDLYRKIKEIESGKKIETAKPPEDPEKPVINADVKNPASLIKRRNTVRTYISQAKNPKSSKKRDPKNLPEWEKELEEIEKLISNDKAK